MISSLSAKLSPRLLTEPGKGLLNRSKGKECIDNNLAFFISKIDERNPPTPFDVEAIAHDVILKNTRESMFNDIKNYVYYAPEKETVEGVEVDISLPLITFVMGIYLRDKYLDRHPELLSAQ
jgi:hypothetical protein